MPVLNPTRPQPATTRDDRPMTTNSATSAALAGSPETAALALSRLRALAAHNSHHDEDWSRALDLITALEGRVVLGDRRTTRAQRWRDEIASIVRRALPSNIAGTVLVAECGRRWPLLGRRPRAVSVQQPVSTGYECRWVREQGPAPFRAAELRRLDRLMRRLERCGVFDMTMRHYGAVEQHAWLTAQPPIAPGPWRLALTVDPPRFVQSENRPAPASPLGTLNWIADAVQHAQSENAALAEICFAFDMAGWTLPPVEPVPGPPRPRPPFPVGVLHAIADMLDWRTWDETTDERVREIFADIGWSIGKRTTTAPPPDEPTAAADGWYADEPDL